MMNSLPQHQSGKSWLPASGFAAFLVLTMGAGSIALHALGAANSRPIPGNVPSGDFRNLPLPVVGYAHNLAHQLHTEREDLRRIDLYRNGSAGKSVAVTLGIPFPPGTLFDAQTLHIQDVHGMEIPARVEPTLRWHFKGGGIRAVRVQFQATMEGAHEQVYFSKGAPVHNSIHGWPYIDGLVTGTDGFKVPGVLATLTPQWMSASLIAGPQVPVVKPTQYDRYFATQFKWASALPINSGSSWLFDRPTTLFQQYVRTGEKAYLEAAVVSYRFYMKHIKRTGAPGWPSCGGGFSLGKVNPCDSKYVYIEPIKLALGLSGDGSEHDSALIQRMVGAWDTGGWNYPAGPYTSSSQRFTEREAGLGLLSVVSAWEITGDNRYLHDIDERLDWLYKHQKYNPDGLGDDGSWRNSWQAHENERYDSATDIRGTSPWMTENIIDGLWHAWLATGDPRIPTMISDFGKYMEQRGWIVLDTITSKERDWRNPCSGANGQISWYWASSHATWQQLAAIEDSDGWYSDAHNVELMLPVAAARYFTSDTKLQQALDRRLALLASSWNTACARNKATPRRFNWNNRGVGVVQWFLYQTETGTTPPGAL